MDGESAEELLKDTIFLVEASDFESHELWRRWSKESGDNSLYGPPAKKRMTWEQMSGWGVKVGQLDGRPVVVSIVWNRVGGCLVAFWHACSEVVDHKMIEDWFGKHFNGRWDNGTRRARCDAQNFHHCYSAIREFQNSSEPSQPNAR